MRSIRAYQNKAATIGVDRAAQITTHAANSAPQTPETQAAKALAILLFNLGAHSLESTAARFRAHPAWRSA